MTRRPLGAALAAWVLLAGALGCGGSTPPRSGAATPSGGARAHRVPVTLILDFVPNAVHAGIYRALAAGYYQRQSIDLNVLQPSSTSSTLKLIDAGRADFGLADGSDVAGEIAAGGNVQAVMAVVQRPLGGLIALASEHLSSPRQLEGRTVGVTGVPSDTAVLRTELAAAGGDPARVRVATVGFNGAAALTAGRVAAFTGFWPSDAVGLDVTGHATRVFKLDASGGPAYPGLVAFATRRRLAADPALVRAFVAATVRGYEDVLRDPRSGLDALLRRNPTLPRALTAASLRALLPLFSEGARFGTLAPARLAALSRWMLANRLIGRAVSPARYGTDAFLPAR